MATKNGVILFNPALLESEAGLMPETPTSFDPYASIHNAHNKGLYDEDPIMTEVGHEFMHSPMNSHTNKTTITTTSTQRQKYRVLGTFSLVGLVYFASCGGPIGSEPVISAGGPLLGLLGVFAYALFCQLPLSLMVTELCCAFPENGGYAVWAMNAFGPFWGFQTGYWSWIASVTNNAIYPGFIYSLLLEAFNLEATSAVAAFFLKVVIAVLLAIPSFLGVRFVGLGALCLLVVVLTTTLLFTVWGFAASDGAWFRLKEVRGPEDVNEDSPEGGIDWTLLVHALFWSFDGMYDISVIGGEVINPVKTYPRVIAAAVALTVLTYTLPWVASVSSDRYPWLEYTEDAFTDIAEAIGGAALHRITLVASIASSVGMFSCTLFFQSFLVQGMSQSRLLPRLLRQRHVRFKTPQFAILLSLLVTLALLGFDFEAILSMTNAFSGGVQLMVVLSMLQLRRGFPYLARPIRVPGNTWTLALMLVPAVAVFLFAIVTTLIEWELAVVVVGLTVPGLLYPVVRGLLAGRTCC